jgi:hypothetical protein
MAFKKKEVVKEVKEVVKPVTPVKPGLDPDLPLKKQREFI